MLDYARLRSLLVMDSRLWLGCASGAGDPLSFLALTTRRVKAGVVDWDVRGRRLSRWKELHGLVKRDDGFAKEAAMVEGS